MNVTKTTDSRADGVYIVEGNGGFWSEVVIEGRIQRRHYADLRRMAELYARELATYYRVAFRN